MPVTTQICEGPIYLPGSQDREGRRVWKVRFRVEPVTPGQRFGPATAINTTGLPQIGDVWLFDDDDDVWAVYQGEAQVTPGNGPPTTMYWIEYTFATTGGMGACTDQQQAHPLLAPAKIEFHFNNFNTQASYDRWNNFIATSSHEPMTGPQTEFQDTDVAVTISQNLLNPQLPLLTVLKNHLNSVDMWGLPPRWIRMSVEALTQEQYGSCYRYYVRRLRFETKRGGWDRFNPDVGTKCLDGYWRKSTADKWEYALNEPVDQRRPTDFIRYVDNKGNATKCVLDGAGQPWVPEEVDDVTDCDFCNAGGGPTIFPATDPPMEWRILNLFTTKGQAIVLGSFGGSGCTWVLVDQDGNEWELTGTAGAGTADPSWVLTVNGGSLGGSPNGGATWSLLTGTLDCGGVNTLASDSYSGTPLKWQVDAVLAPNTFETVEDCALCGNAQPYNLGQTKPGAPSVLRVQDLSAAGSSVPIKLTHTTGCNWAYTDEIDNYLLEFVAELDFGYWKFTVNTTEVEWRCNEWNWNCRGPNVLTVFGTAPVATPPWPDQIHIVPGNQPGARKVEYYGEADLVTLLGLPADL